jgi:hypothetical protein
MTRIPLIAWPSLSISGEFLLVLVLLVLLVLAPCQKVQCKDQDSAAVSIVGAGALLAGRFDNAAQVTQDQDRRRQTAQDAPLPHVIVTVEPTQRSDWELWRVHMDVDPEVAREAGADTSLDAVWAMNISQRGIDHSLQLIPYSLRASVNIAAVKAASFDEAQWLSLEACALRGQFDATHIAVQVGGDEMCVAAAMGLGGKLAFLPSLIEREGDSLHYQLMYLGNPLRVDARVLKNG